MKPKLLFECIKRSPDHKKITSFLTVFFIAFLLCSSFIFISLQASAQQGNNRTFDRIIIKGRVINDKGEALAGASIKLKNTEKGSVSNSSGNFSLSVNKGDTVIVSFLGYEGYQFVANNSKEIRVLLSASLAINLNDVIVVAYGTQKKATITGAITTVAATDIVKNTNQDVTNTLTGRAPGIRVTQQSSQPGKFDSQIDIRGFSSVDPNDILGQETSGPLFVIDGVPRDKATFDHLDPNEIESLSVLKDATAAIYGVEAANGVILVTTKKGSQKDLQIDFTTRQGRQSITKYPSLCNGYQYAVLYDEQQINNIISSKSQYIPPLFSLQNIADYQSGKLPSVDWLKLLLRDHSAQQQYNLTVSGGNSKVKYFLSGGYFNQQGLISSGIDNSQKYNLRGVLSLQVAKGLSFDMNLGFNDVISNAPHEAIWSLIRNSWRIAPSETVYSNGDPHYYRNFSASQQPNPMAETNQNIAGYDNANNKALTSTFNLNYIIPFVKGLSAKVLVAYDNNWGFDKNFAKAWSQYQYDPNSGVQKAFVFNSPSNLSNNYSSSIRNDLQFQLNYQNHFGKNNFSALVLYEQLYNQGNSFSAQTFYVVDIIDQLSAGVHGGSTPDQVNSGYGQSSRASYVGKLNYDYAGKYLAEFGFREDGSSYFPPNKRWGFFPYVSAGWRISEEPFIKNNTKFIDNIKLRGSIGKLGDDVAAANGFPAFLTGYNYPSTASGSLAGSVFGGGFVRGVDFKNAADANITWYTSTTTNIGLDLSFWHEKLSFTGEIFRRDRDGLLATPIIAIPGTFGAVQPQINLNSDRTQGFEITIGHKNKIRELEYSFSGNMSFARSQWRHYEQSTPTNATDNYVNQHSSRYKDQIYGYKVLGQFANFSEIYSSPVQDGAGNRTILPGDFKYADLTGDGIIDGKDQTYIANGGAKPLIYYGLNIEASWRGIDFSMLIQGAAMYSVIYQDQLSRPFYFGDANPISAFFDRWHRQDVTDPNSPWVAGKFPSTGQRTNYIGNNSFNTFNAAYVRLKSLELGYTLPGKILGKAGVKSFRVFANAYDLLTLTGKGLNFIDPEYTDTRLYSYNYPITLNMNLGARLSF